MAKLILIPYIFQVIKKGTNQVINNLAIFNLNLTRIP